MNASKIELFLSEIKKSPYAVGSTDATTMPFRGYFSELSDYHINAKTESAESLLLSMTPEFQRENTKWTMSMQVKFIENLLSGCKTNLLMYAIGQQGDKRSLDHCFILDGLQRNTAIADFINCKFKIFHYFYYTDLDSRHALGNCRLDVQFYLFPTHRAACLHYIAMNEGITHSPDDLVTAYTFLRNNP
jgi:hypothetical protein